MGSEWNCDNETYHAECDSVSHSALEVFREWAPAYHAQFVAKSIPRSKPSPAMQLGSAFHCKLLEPQHYADRFVCGLDIDRRSNRNKELHAEFEAENAGKTVLSMDQCQTVSAMVDAAKSVKQVASFLEAEQQREVAYRWVDPVSGVQCKCRPDILLFNGVVADVKTSSDPVKWASQAANFGYHRQGAFYVDGVQIVRNLPTTPAIAHIVVGTVEPYPVIVYMLGPQSLQLGREQNRADLNRLADCRKSGDWTDPKQVEIQHVELPRWAFY